MSVTVVFTPAARERASMLAERVDGVRLVPVPGANDGWTADDRHSLDAVVLMSTMLDDVPGLRELDVPVVADLSHLDLMAWVVGGPEGDRAAALGGLVARADLVLAADPRQRDMLLGALAGRGRINPTVYDADRTLESLVRVDQSGDALVAFCRAPARAADAYDAPPALPVRVGDLAKALTFLREGGIRMLAVRVTGRIRRVVRDGLRKIRR